ncbi:HdeD family acid-resistance protein [Microbulbifer sp. S227A]|uniref:HdeD family acid-resistance protein n=1 Tax=Microbulbifer sp. S227A TaxID=3415131 RepID=UPI003C7B12B0
MKTWVKWLILGLVSVVFGVFVLSNPVAASISVTVLAGIMFMLSGGIQVFAGFGEDGAWGKFLGIGLGVLMLLLGLSLVWHPLEGVISLTLLVAILFAASGVARVITAFQMRETPFFWPMLISGAVSVLLAGYIFANFASVAPSLLGVLLGIELLFNGAGLIALAFFLRTAKGVLRDKLQAKFDK